MLVIRCERCQTVVWFTRDRSSSITCSHCDQQYELPTNIRERTREEIHRQAYGLATELSVDFPSATSMVFGILKLPQVQEFLVESEDEEDQKDQGPGLKESDWSGSFDEAFKPAVEAGRLTSHDALHRGRRDHYAAKIVERHGISLKDAFRVADNEETLLAVLRRRKAASPRKLMKPRRRQFAVFIALSLVAVALLSLWRIDSGIRKDVDRAEAREAERVERERDARQSQGLAAQLPMLTPGPLTELYYDEKGRITRITAQRPESVLRAYCRRPEVQPLSLAEGMLPDKNLWLGVYADSTSPDSTHAIAIRKRGKGGKWFAGSGQGEIEILNLEPTRLGKLRELDSTALALNVVEVW